MKRRYTLTLEAGGKEVFKRWTGDRDEMRRLMLEALATLDAHPALAASFLQCLDEANLKHMVGDETWGFAVNSKDLTSTLHLEVKTPLDQSVVTEHPVAG